MSMRRLLLAPALLASLLACDDETEQPIDLGPVGPPQLVFVDPSSDGPQPACRPVAVAPDPRVPLLVEPSELILRPPGACGVYAQCGHLVLFVDDVPNNTGAVPAIDLLLRKLADPYHDGQEHAGTGEPDVLHLRVEVHDDLGDLMVDHAGDDLADELELVTRESCTGPPRDPP